ncbi:MAG: hypothetical protein IKE09_07085 [Clostridiales bacterium]|nr:hypothetical protein [Clostridiales bacterium]
MHPEFQENMNLKKAQETIWGKSKEPKRQLSAIGEIIDQICTTTFTAIVARLITAAVPFLMAWIYFFAEPKGAFLHYVHVLSYCVVLGYLFLVYSRAVNDIKYWLGK